LLTANCYLLGFRQERRVHTAVPFQAREARVFPPADPCPCKLQQGAAAMAKVCLKAGSGRNLLLVYRQQAIADHCGSQYRSIGASNPGIHSLERVACPDGLPFSAVACGLLPMACPCGFALSAVACCLWPMAWHLTFGRALCKLPIRFSREIRR
jgi:hypothetical protein